MKSTCECITAYMGYGKYLKAIGKTWTIKPFSLNNSNKNNLFIRPFSNDIVWSQKRQENKLKYLSKLPSTHENYQLMPTYSDYTL